MSLVMSGSFGAPEYAFEHATRIAEEVAPVVLWIDELENAFGYDERVSGAGNVNIFSSFLTWMQEKPPEVFLAATANRIQALPAELMRKGRFPALLSRPAEQAGAGRDLPHPHRPAGAGSGSLRSRLPGRGHQGMERCRDRGGGEIGAHGGVAGGAQFQPLPAMESEAKAGSPR